MVVTGLTYLVGDATRVRSGDHAVVEGRFYYATISTTRPSRGLKPRLVGEAGATRRGPIGTLDRRGPSLGAVYPPASRTFSRTKLRTLHRQGATSYG